MGLDKFSAALDSLKGFNVNLYVGEDVFKGKLIGVEEDHVVLETDHQFIFYYSIDKIQAITKNTKEFRAEQPTVTFQKTHNLNELLTAFQNTWVNIFSIHKQKFSGVLSDIDTDFATVINGEERILIKTSHVANIFKGVMKEEVKSKDTTEDDQNKNQTKANQNTTAEKSENKNHSKETMEDHNCSEKHSTIQENKETEQEVFSVKMETSEPNNTEVWSQPIKPLVVISQPNKEVKSANLQKKQNVIDITTKSQSQKEKQNHDCLEVPKKEESKMKTSPSILPNESKPLKEETFNISTNTPAPPLQFTKRDSKSSKTNETASEVKSDSKFKAEAPTIDVNAKNKIKGWQQKDKETSKSRFSGEPTSLNDRDAFPFAGWPNRNKKNSNFYF